MTEHLFHAVAAANLSQMVYGGQVHFYGRSAPDAELEDEVLEHILDGGWIYSVSNRDLDLCFNEFVGDGLVLELAPMVAHPEIVLQGRNGREKVIRVQEWQVVGAIRPVTDEDGEVVAQEEISFEELIDGNF
jgi:hypothetical protein